MQSFLCNLRQLGGRDFESRLVTVVTDRFLMLMLIMVILIMVVIMILMILITDQKDPIFSQSTLNKDL